MPDAMTIQTPPGRVILTYGRSLMALVIARSLARQGIEVIGCDDVATVDVVGRGRPLRRHRSLPFGANVNFVSPEIGTGRWRMRTYERGVEAETLACGSGSVAAAILLTSWSDDSGSANTVELVTSSGNPLRVTIRRESNSWFPTLRGEGRVVFRGELSEISAVGLGVVPAPAPGFQLKAAGDVDNRVLHNISRSVVYIIHLIRTNRR